MTISSMPNDASEFSSIKETSSGKRWGWGGRKSE